MLVERDEPESRLVDHNDRTPRTAQSVEQLHAVVDDLEAMHPERNFPLNGHLMGSIGEVAAEAMFHIAFGSRVDGRARRHCRTRRQIDIKATYGSSGVAIRQSSHTAAAAFIVLGLSRNTALSTR